MDTIINSLVHVGNVLVSIDKVYVIMVFVDDDNEYVVNYPWGCWTSKEKAELYASTAKVYTHTKNKPYVQELVVNDKDSI